MLVPRLEGGAILPFQFHFCTVEEYSQKDNLGKGKACVVCDFKLMCFIVGKTGTLEVHRRSDKYILVCLLPAGFLLS